MAELTKLREALRKEQKLHPHLFEGDTVIRAVSALVEALNIVFARHAHPADENDAGEIERANPSRF